MIANGNWFVWFELEGNENALSFERSSEPSQLKLEKQQQQLALSNISESWKLKICKVLDFLFGSFSLNVCNETQICHCHQVPI